MTKSVVVLSTLDTKGRETAFLKEQIERDGCRAVLVDMGVVGKPTINADVTREQVAEAGGTPLAKLLADADPREGRAGHDQRRREARRRDDHRRARPTPSSASAARRALPAPPA